MRLKTGLSVARLFDVAYPLQGDLRLFLMNQQIRVKQSTTGEIELNVSTDVEI